MKFFRPQLRLKKFQGDSMQKTRLYIAEHEVDRKLAWFGVVREELIAVARQTLASRSDAIDLDVRSMRGQLSYLYGTRNLRILFRAKGWRIDCAENVESVVHDQLGVKIIFQNVDQACSPYHSPQAISAKGPAAGRMIDGTQGHLFAVSEAPEAIPQSLAAKANATLWCFCMSFDGDNVSVEFSRPASIVSNNYAAFLERIFIVSGGDWAGSVSDDDDDVVEVLPTIARR